MNFTVFLYSLIDILNEMSPYILLGFLIAGLLHEFVKPETMSRHLSGNGWKPVIKAAMLGVPLPLCSCGVLPTAVGLHRQGASKGATTSFLIATPQTGVDSIAATYSLLGLPMAILRPIAALAGGFAGGMGVTLLANDDKTGETVASCSTIATAASVEQDNASDVHKPWYTRLTEAVRYGLVEMVASVGKWLVIGLIIAALITVFVPDQFLVSLSDRPLLAMLAMIIIAIPMYVCATGSIPIAMSLMMKGLNPGAAFVLLMAGPAANFASMMVLGRAIGKKATAIYTGSVIVTALFFGLIVDYFFPAEWFANLGGKAACTHSCHTDFGLFETGCSVLLVFLLIYSYFKTRNHSHQINTSDMTKTFKIDGMSCNHCRMTVEKAISAVPGVEKVVVDLSGGVATVDGTYDNTAIFKAVRDSGFDIDNI
ncbi:MAG: SO_0444 family Cu/Zn efflux transporter [Muribaculaceae bacterium]|nr:SO_0444 family Cu/Zn efflux transporter [Muribaculaceae bacterium]